MAHDAEIRSVVEQACVEFETDLRGFLAGVLRDSHLADDAFQKTVVKAIEAAATVKRETVRGWLFKIALNEAREIKRKESRDGRLHRAVWEQNSESIEYNVSLSLEANENKSVIELALERLAENYREVVVRRIQQGQTFAVIAEEMNRPLGTVLTWMRRALTQLREMKEIQQLSNVDE